MPLTTTMTPTTTMLDTTVEPSGKNVANKLNERKMKREKEDER